MKKRIQLSGLRQNTMGHTAIGLWRHPESQTHRYRDLAHWVDTARILERGCFDILFIADAQGPLEVYQGKVDAALRDGIQTPCDDPLLSISAMAAATRRLSFTVTVSITYERPYAFARKMTIRGLAQTEGRDPGSLDVFTRLDPERSWTPRTIAEFVGSVGGPVIVGSPVTVTNALENGTDEADIDGFNVADPSPPVTLRDFVDMVVPALRRRGRLWLDFEGSSLRGYFQGTGHNKLSVDHPGTVWRRP